MKKTALKRSVDLLMTAALLLLMPYSLIGEAAHEWLGMGMAVLFVLHLALNWQWVRGLRRGRWSALARQVHMDCSFWGFVCMSPHLGLRWTMMLNAVRRFSVTRTRGFRIPGGLIAAYGVYAFWKRGFPNYLLLRTHFLFLDNEEPILFFFLDYLAIMGLFVFCAHYGGRLLIHKKMIWKEDD